MFWGAFSGDIENVKSAIKRGADVNYNYPGMVSYYLSIYKYIPQQ